MTNLLKYLAFVVSFLALSPLLNANSDVSVAVREDGLAVWDVWARAGKPNAAVFMKIKNDGAKERKIIAAKVDGMPRVELHDHIWEGDVMKMRKVDHLLIPAGGTIELMPGGKHVMLFDVGDKLQEGSSFKLTLETDNGQSLFLDVPVKPMSYNPKLEQSGCNCH